MVMKYRTKLGKVNWNNLLKIILSALLYWNYSKHSSGKEILQNQVSWINKSSLNVSIQINQRENVKECSHHVKFQKRTLIKLSIMKMEF